MINQLRQRLAHHRPLRIREQGGKAGVLVAITDCSHNPEVILTRRAAHLSSHSGEVAFPGGKHDDTDPDLLFTALREAQEEVGLVPDQVEVLGQLGQVLSKNRLQVTPWVGLVPVDVELTVNPDELDAVFRVPLRFFLETNSMQTHRINAYGREMDVPAWRYEGFLIWGLTAYVLVDLLNLVFDASIPMKTRPEHRSDQAKN